VPVARDGDWSAEAGDGEGAIELGKSGVHGAAHPEAARNEAGDQKHAEKECGCSGEAGPAAAARLRMGWGLRGWSNLIASELSGEGQRVVGQRVRGEWVLRRHAIIPV